MVEHAPLGLLGGTFDPIHYGHLRLADDVRDALALPEVRLIPGGDPPHRGEPPASAVHRLAMLDLACQEFPALTIDVREIRRSGKSYAVDTLEALRAEAPGRPLLWIIGADSLLGLPQWHRWRELFGLAHLVVAERPGIALEAALPAALVPEWNARLVSDPAHLRQSLSGAIYRQRVVPQPISASVIRAAIARGAAVSVRGLLPDGVLAYIERNGLYRAHRPS